MKKFPSFLMMVVFMVGLLPYSTVQAGGTLSAEDLKAFLPSHSVILSQTSYDLCQTGKADTLVYYRLGGACGMAVITPERALAFHYVCPQVDHLFFSGKKNPGVVFLDPASKTPFVEFNNDSDPLHPQYHAFKWARGAFREVDSDWWKDPQIKVVLRQSAVEADNAAAGVPGLYRFRHGQMVMVAAKLRRFFDPYFKKAWKSLDDPALGSVPGGWEAKAAYLPVFLYAGREAEGLRFADRLLQEPPSELTIQALDLIHTSKGNLLMALGRDEEGLDEYQAADDHVSGMKNATCDGAFLREARYFEKRGNRRRAALAYEQALHLSEPGDEARDQPIRERIAGLWETINGGEKPLGASEPSPGPGQPATVTIAENSGMDATDSPGPPIQSGGNQGPGP